MKSDRDKLVSGRVGESSVNFVHDGGDAEGREAVLKANVSEDLKIN